MSTSFQKSRFLDAAKTWICDGYVAELRYLARRFDTAAALQLWEASLTLAPVATAIAPVFKIETPSLSAGLIRETRASQSQLLDILSLAADGVVAIDGSHLALGEDSTQHHISDMALRDRWYFPLHLHVSTNRIHAGAAQDLGMIDAELRLTVPPFDGTAAAGRVADCAWRRATRSTAGCGVRGGYSAT
jgi:hypothetical protein